MELKKKFKVLGFVETVQKHLFDFFVFFYVLSSHFPRQLFKESHTLHGTKLLLMMKEFLLKLFTRIVETCIVSFI